MSTIVVQAFITLDGVVQASGGPDEDHKAISNTPAGQPNTTPNTAQMKSTRSSGSGRPRPRLCCSAARRTRSSPAPGACGTRTPRAAVDENRTRMPSLEDETRRPLGVDHAGVPTGAASSVAAMLAA